MLHLITFLIKCIILACVYCLLIFVYDFRYTVKEKDCTKLYSKLVAAALLFELTSII